MDERRHINRDELLDWLCWKRATTAERFYPPDETAEECADNWEQELSERAVGREYGEHNRALLEAVEFFNDMEAEGYDPKARAQRHIEESELDLPSIDWTWYEQCVVQKN